MTDLVRYYDESYPPSLWQTPIVPATGATAGVPGTWTPAGSQPPASVAALIAGTPNVVTASPATAWVAPQFVQTRTAGAAGSAYWSGTTWVIGAAGGSADPTTAWPKVSIVAWLLDHGVTFDEAALEQLTKAELLELVADLVDEPEPEPLAERDDEAPEPEPEPEAS